MTPTFAQNVITDFAQSNIVVHVKHHLAHASSAYHLSGFREKTAILSIDGKGEYATIVGTGGADEITGTAGRDVIVARGVLRTPAVYVDGEKLVGILTNRDLRFETDMTKKVSDVMTSEKLVTVSEGISLQESKKLLHEHRIEKLLVVDKNGRLTGMITIKDIEKIKKYPNACKDSLGRLRVGAAIGVGPDMEERAEALLKAGADVIVEVCDEPF